MLREFGPSTFIAISIGVVIAVIAFVPVAAHRYRKTGRLRAIDLVALLAVAMYAVALWSYTLIPLPDSSTYQCVGANTVPFEFVRDILRTRGQGSLLSNSALLHSLFNVVLFLPLGAFLRWLLKRGVIIATVTGFAISAVIECTQLTGLWGLYPCAYRYFDVDDLILNTAGALLGSLVAWPFSRLARGRAPMTLPTTVTVGRRLVGVLVDLMAIVFVSYGLLVAWVAIRVYVFGAPLADASSVGDRTRWLLGWLPALVFEGWWVMVRGRTCGEAVVALRPAEPGGRVWPRRLVKLIAGVGGYVVTTALTPWLPLLPSLFALVSLIVVLATKDHRGLSGLAARLPMSPG